MPASIFNRGVGATVMVVTVSDSVSSRRRRHALSRWVMNGEGWENTLDDLDRRRQRAWAMGGPERLAKHREKGKLDARARVERLLDKAPFSEFGTLVGGEAAADGIVAGSGWINGCPAMGSAEDLTNP